jgi:hypothetical protein
MVLLLSIVVQRNQVKGDVGYLWRVLDRRNGSNVAVRMQRGPPESGTTSPSAVDAAGLAPAGERTYLSSSFFEVTALSRSRIKGANACRCSAKCTPYSKKSIP